MFDMLVLDRQILTENFQDVFILIFVILNECSVEKTNLYSQQNWYD
jgi:hypothetical protein